MEHSYKIVVSDTGILTKLCGANDSNLKLIEQHLGVPVFMRGNELSVEQDDPAIQQQFRFIIDRIIDEIEEGYADSEDAVASILNTDLNPDYTPTKDYFSSQREHATMNEGAIVVPGAQKKVYPKTQNQADYVRLLRTKDMVFCSGSAGSGKTFLAVCEALRLVLSKEKKGIILTRPVVEAGESLGFLPGDLEQKTAPYLRPLYDSMETVLSKDTVKKLIENDIIETAPLAYMRGRTLNDSVIILDEAQNTTCEQMKMFLTRMGNGSKVFVTGDVTQIDLPKRCKSGLVHALEVLSGIPEIGIMQMTGADVVRNPLVKKIVQAYENAKDN
ncbi:MAG: PhoH family protein [Treponema sp.]|uniref:PhoH family protein n=1 Tax=Treponema sp. TaxID=166 RepID=UPI001B753E39|nr:PhoH family protein [Treponema sp.]MBP5402910.1 PhoH family protein [Treponema sp.]MBR5932964.1 PhoH family protein [Treponema sp.]